jgi:hypothetical protein
MPCANLHACFHAAEESTRASKYQNPLTLIVSSR